MRLRILSDLHVEFADFQPKAEAVDLVILAGDIGTNLKGLTWARERFAPCPILYVPGNHELYGAEYHRWHTDAAHCAAAHDIWLGVKFSHCVETASGPMRLLATTLWTDFALFGEAKADIAMLLASMKMSDYRAIRINQSRLTPEHTRAIHGDELRWLQAEVAAAKAAGERIVVVTHHAPSLSSVHKVYLNDPLTPAFASNLDELAAAVDVWVHGHTHHSNDYMLGNCRVLSNPRGYPLSKAGSFENKSFNPELFIDL